MGDSNAIPDNVQVDHPKFACERCKRRKIKCDRTLPTCGTCVKVSRECVYPLTANKPGPKPGSQQRRKSRPVLTQTRLLTNVLTPNSIPKSTPDDLAQRNSGIPSPVSSIVPTPRGENSESRGQALTQLLHLSHEPLQSSSDNATNESEEIEEGHDFTVHRVCEAFGITTEQYFCLLTSYFKHMTAFSLFHRPTFHIKLSSISPPLHVQALLASMFAVSIRFEDSRTGSRSLDHALTSDKFHKLSQRLVDEALLECEDETPPLCLLQALILVTFQQLIESVRGRSWRRLGTCIRIAYELQLHLVDKSRHPNSPSSENGCLEEEKRRAWWTIWEFDVYASTIRRLPTAIDWRYNVTWLPIHDDLWFANETAESCRLDLDPAVAWKLLQKTGNTSPRAWFIVVNALMRTAQLLSYPQVFSDATRRDSASSGQDSETLNTIANSLYCFSSALPPNLLYRGEFLRFEPDDPDSFQRDSGKHCIYIMIQLTKFMINHHQVFESASRLLSLINATTSETPQQPQLSPADQAAWNHYLSAASEIVGLVRDCSPKHVIYVNPFLANTIWLAAAAQVVSKAFAPILVDRRTAESNLDVLKLNLNAYVSIWGSSNSQSQKLTTLETRLNNSRGQAGNSEKQPLATSIQTDTFENATRRTDVSGNSRLTDSTSLNIASDEPSMAANQGLPLMDWSYPQGFNLDWPTPGNQLGSDLWGWYSDEILMSGTLE